MISRQTFANESSQVQQAEQVLPASETASAKPQYGQQLEGTQEYYTQQHNGAPYVPRVQQSPVPSRSGFVTAIPLPFDMYGTGPIKILFLCGIGLARGSWKYQVDFFARKPEYTCLVIENRGYDDYEAHIPLQIAGSKQFARDMQSALVELDWTLPKSIHVVGLGLGGMIALQLCRICPEYVASLHLVSTGQTFKRPAFSAADSARSIQLLKRRSKVDRAETLLDLLLPANYLYASDPEHTNFENYRAQLLHQHKVQKLFSDEQKTLNFYLQVLAYRRHSIQKTDLWEIAAKVRFIFVSGANDDSLIDPECSRDLMAGLHAQGRMYEGGHMIPWQYKEEFNADQEAMMLRADREYTEYPPMECLCINDLVNSTDEPEPVIIAK
ncbi:putative Alpha/beta hydrolase [Taphrina deformans PYCC 5710]|uniref:Alpha/beta hydrolase n=1 Tax=Taphrina deformans (strain PYCC 5710 / ATCC 11124 / CBS 356.35 / IMI 108563 / JCM 9778 / NBRC 8474) TaxID=1097556 RepID=R4XAP4_TAPDE|nr:putative Alpha/beta hydrolase [Taphrina deformans PYCC 5710]|eukprot:CCG81383.1 putative Alpha/beta hydrolase [Taphrina deformans PYCC 5710]